MNGVISMIPNREFKLNELSLLNSSASVIDGVVNNSDELPRSTSNLNIYDLKTFSSDGNYKELIVPNPYPAKKNAPVHPSVVKSRKMFGGFKFWLAYTPYPDTNSDFENPCVTATNDFKTFEEPSANPLVNKPSPGYNADTNLVFNEDETILYLLYRKRDGFNTLMIMETLDGITWSTPFPLFTSNTNDFGTPSAWFNEGKMVIVYMDLDLPNPKPFFKVESLTNDVYGSYSAPIEMNVPSLPDEGIHYWWHTFFSKVSDTQIIGLVQRSVGGGGVGDTYLVQSFDGGLNFEICTRKVTKKGIYYRSTFYRDENSLVFILGTLDGVLTIFRSELGFLEDSANYNNRLSSYLINNTYDFTDVLFLDSFNRADGGSLGVSDSGQTMTISGSGYEIKDNKAFPLSNGAKAHIDVGKAKYTIHTKINMTDGIQQWIMFKQKNTTNLLRLGFGSGKTSNVGVNIALEEIINGVVANSFVPGVKIFNKDELRIECTELSVKVLLNGEVAFAYIPSFLFSKGSVVGIQSSVGATTSFDYFIVTK